MVYTEVVGWRPMGYCPKLEKAVTGEEGSLTKSLEDQQEVRVQRG